MALGANEIDAGVFGEKLMPVPLVTSASKKGIGSLKPIFVYPYP
ncbi:hypothetical protein [Bacillus paramycoides]|uniref:Uncharacterized protein n=1 Tax=Bacillus paramycoides TaxID=2026194 RepID=A0ABU6MU55_9BACI|nr:hypothetical protein [Bacillus paramycoides]MED0988280.1 hypothetical protein [Bacillus paramycoides]MED1092201.1 hypothetical protein [Bacillus paramycoides]MED1107548.1 hypothetical protein [Bacillus paramycoides]MED1564751.1 hypothetical protein [Bacillus paramycoides]